MALIEDRLIGFDIRELWLDPNDLWESARRDAFLLRTDALKPLSTDALVWPSVFGAPVQALPLKIREPLRLASLAAPTWIGPNACLWEDLPAMERHLLASWAEPQPHAVIAVSWHSENAFSDAGQFGPYLGCTNPAARPPDWRFLGYDVSDGSLLSGLSNCGYSNDETGSLRARWRGRLNAWHLFNDVTDAFSFRGLANDRVPEHAPFFVFGIHLISATGDDEPLSSFPPGHAGEQAAN